MTDQELATMPEDQEPNPVHIMRAIEHLHSQAVADDERMVILDYLMAQHRKYNEKVAQPDIRECPDCGAAHNLTPCRAEGVECDCCRSILEAP